MNPGTDLWHNNEEVEEGEPDSVRDKPPKEEKAVGCWAMPSHVPVLFEEGNKYLEYFPR